MDIDQCLKEIRELVKLIDEATSANDLVAYAADLAEHVEALDGWMSTVGMLPKEWARGR